MRTTFETCRGACRNARLTPQAALTQGLRDFYGAYTYERDAEPGQTFHILCSDDGSEVPE
jgi:6-phosphogluconate dehydrogenase